MVHKFKGVGVALVTPFTHDDKIDFDSLGKLIDHVTSGGVDYLVVQGTTGESVTTTAKEKSEILQFVIEKNHSKLPVVFGTGGNNTSLILDNISSTDFEGVDAILSVSPYYNKPSQDGIIEHFQRIADTCPVPIILYNVPGRTSSNLLATTTIKLARHHNIIGIKEASGDLLQCLTISNSTNDDFLLISGDDMLTIPILSHGGVGVISVLANAFPDNFKVQINHFINGELTKAWQKSSELLELNPLMYEESNPVGIKQALSELGLIKNFVRLPLLPASESLMQRVKVALSALRA